MTMEGSNSIVERQSFATLALMLQVASCYWHTPSLDPCVKQSEPACRVQKGDSNVLISGGNLKLP
jgi:hypothetical protein